ncbi:enoyl-CoA hydratase [Gordonia crocea]|uniref:Enoyl-CoA hydratase n=1 Tax=Gordonia crocea TaxID=589162 RepID=A0A7M3SU87_9ACTN|nr:enoyl-CoA hydratase [Gordonia crocea]GED96211.1 enoyl-CoA hydratase [Gordonia crocea]
MANELEVTRDAATAIITLNRPESRNALTAGLIAGLQQAIADAGADDTVAAVILTGTDPAFCAGIDLKAMADGGDWAGLAFENTPTGHPWAPIDKPIIGAINGPAVTGGLELALACDILVASERAVFADTHARVGVMPLWGLSARLPEMVGFGFAKRMSLSGMFVDAESALAHGLVTEVVAHDDLLPLATRIASDIAANNRAAVTALLGSYQRIRDDHLTPQLQTEADTAQAWMSTGGVDRVGASAESVIEQGRSQLS